MKWGWICVLGVGWVAGCSGTGDGDSSADSSGDGFGTAGPIECGDATCDGTQICVVLQGGPFQAGGTSTSSCEAGPSGCDVTSLCDCPASQGDWEGLPVTGCSILGGRTLYVTDTSCGEEPPCNEAQVCVMVGSPLGEVKDQHCAALPLGCEISQDFCETDCAGRVAAAEGGVAGGAELNGCMGADWAVGVYVKE